MQNIQAKQNMLRDSLDFAELMNKARIVYKQDEGFYISSKEVNGFHISVLKPYDSTFKFSYYNPGDREDENKVLKYSKLDNPIYKSFNCDLCTISENDNLVQLSKRQNLLYVDPEAPSVLIQRKFLGNYQYTISGTVPQYYYNHVLFLPENHVPTYAVFMNHLIFYDVYSFLEFIYDETKNYKAVFNGGTGSDIYHFHLHITDQKFALLESLTNDLIPKDDTNCFTYFYNSPIYRFTIFYSSDKEKLFNVVSEYVAKYYLMLTGNDREKNTITANFLINKVGNKTIYYCVLHLVNKDQKYRSFEIEGNLFKVIPAGYIAFAIKYKTNYVIEDFANKMIKTDINKLYIAMDPINKPSDFIYTNIFLENIFFATNGYELFSNLTIEMLYYYLEINKNKSIPIKFFKKYMLEKRCFALKCDLENVSKFKYLYSYIFTRMRSLLPIFVSQIKDMKIQQNISYLKKFSDDGINSSDYLYFKGNFSQNFVKRIVKNLMESSFGRKVESKQYYLGNEKINDWIDYGSEKIGEPSANGYLTIGKLKNPKKYDFVIKLSKITERSLCEFENELDSSLRINNLRRYIPNFIICYGGFVCNSDEKFEKLCTIDGNPNSYIVLENVKNSNTFKRNLLLPSYNSKIDSIDVFNYIYQTIVSLAFAYEKLEFTHYDLHVDNVMLYDFIKNNNYLSQFPIPYEKTGAQIPQIDNVLFRYYLENYETFIVPAKMLTIIIDYGHSFVKNHESKKCFDEKFISKYGFTNYKNNSITDIYTFLMDSLLNIVSHKPYLLYQNSKLLNLFIKFIQSYKEILGNDKERVTPEQFFEGIRKLVSERKNTKKEVSKYIKSKINPKYFSAGEYVHYLNTNFLPEYVSQDFSTPKNVAIWIRDNLFKDDMLEELINQDTTHVFNWGLGVSNSSFDDNYLKGIKPNKDTIDLNEMNKYMQEIKTNSVKNFAKNVFK